MSSLRRSTFGPPPVPPPLSPGRRLLTGALARPSLGALVGVVAVLVFFGVAAPGLMDTGGLASVLDRASLLGIGAVAVAMLLVAGQFDLSIGAIAVASSLITALLVAEAGWGVWPALGVSLAAALLLGAVNGLIVVSSGLPSFLVTLATFLALQGASLVVARTVAGSSRIGNLEGARGWESARLVFGSTVQAGDGRFRIALVWWAAATLFAAFLLWRTRFGNAVFASGGEPRAARELGVPVARTNVLLFLGTAAAGWLVGILGLIRINAVQVDAQLTPAVAFLVIAVIGGCLLTGGYGSVFGAALGALLYGVAEQGIAQARWDPQWFQVLLGVLLMAALLANGVVRRKLLAVPRS